MSEGYQESSDDLLEAKKAKLHEAMEDTSLLETQLLEPADLTVAVSFYDRFESESFAISNETGQDR